MISFKCLIQKIVFKSRFVSVVVNWNATNQVEVKVLESLMMEDLDNNQESYNDILQVFAKKRILLQNSELTILHLLSMSINPTTHAQENIVIIQCLLVQI